MERLTGTDMDDLLQKYIGAIAGVSDEAALEDLRLAALGKKGEISLKMRELGQMDPAERQVAGAALNALKDEIDTALRAKKAALGDAALDERLRAEWLVPTDRGSARKSSRINTTSATSSATSVPARPISMPTRAAVSAGASPGFWSQPTLAGGDQPE